MPPRNKEDKLDSHSSIQHRRVVMQVIMGLSRGILILNKWVEVEDGIEDKVPPIT